ncbi:MAG: ATP-dependent helicase [Thermodesulfobacteriota bacterium]
MQQSLFTNEQPSPGNTAEGFRRSDLNEAQLEAATCTGVPVLVIAGAGTGKTRTLVYRMAYLMEQGVAADNILLLTFTRKAAQEMVDRAGLLINDPGQRITGGTFHSMANVLLRKYGHHLGYQPNFNILDRSDSEGIINLIKSSLELGGSGKRFPSKRVICNLFSRSVNKCADLETVIEDQYSHLYENRADLERILDNYRKFKMEHGLMDYDDLLVNLRRVMSDFEQVREEVSGRFKHILVDEYQDTNPIQAEIVRLTASGHDNIMVVGDDSQSIYSFRGADFRNIMDFPKTFPDTRIVRLEENYRSTQAILTVTNAIIDKAEEKYTKKLFSSIEGGDKPILYGAWDETNQARWVAERIVELQEGGTPLSEVAVLFRSGFHSYKLEMELTNRQIVFEKRGGLKLTESAHIKDVLSFMRVVNNPSDNLSWNRILLLLEKVGPKTARKMLDAIRVTEDPFAVLAGFPAGKSWQKGLRDLLELLNKISKPGVEPVAIFDQIMDYYRDIFERIYHDDFPTRSRDLEQMRLLVAGYKDLQSLIDDTVLDPPVPDESSGRSVGEAERLILSTIHSAKGLEWDNVFVINMAMGRFPSCQPFMRQEWEEERRMFYVAATRARRNLFLTYPREVLSADRQMQVGGMSPFLAEISPSLLASGEKSTQAGYKHLPSSTGGGSRVDVSRLEIGVTVRHPFFGEGKVEKMVGNRSVDVYFPRHGRKTLHLDYAKLEVVE